MKSLKQLLALALCLMLCIPAGLAQELPAQAPEYVIGDPSVQALMGAFENGKLVTGEFALDLDLNEQALGISGEEAAILDAVLDALRRSTLTLGAGRIDGGVRLALGAQMTAEADTAGVYALADVTLEGVAVESDLFEGKRVSASWETLLALAGASESDIAMFTSLKEINFEELLGELTAEIAPMVESGLTIALPYAQTVASFVAGLPMETSENLTEEGYPPTALEISLAVTQKDLGDLLALLCDQFEKDDAARNLTASLIDLTGESITTAQLIAKAREIAGSLTDTSMPLYIFLGMNENGVPLYVEGYLEDAASGESLYGGVYCYEEAEKGVVAELMGGYYDSEGNPLATLYLGGSHLADEADPNVHSTAFEMYLGEGDVSLIDMQILAATQKDADSALPAYDTFTSVGAYIAAGEGDAVQIVSSSETHSALTAAGGEAVTGSGATDTYVGETVMSTSASADIQIDPTADGGVTGHYRTGESAPAAGVDNCAMTILVASEAIDPAASAALEQIALEEITNAGMDALKTQIKSALTEEKLPALMKVLPKALVDMLAAQ